MKFFELSLRHNGMESDTKPDLTFWVQAPSRQDVLSIGINLIDVHHVSSLPITHSYRAGLDAILPKERQTLINQIAKASKRYGLAFF